MRRAFTSVRGAKGAIGAAGLAKLEDSGTALASLLRVRRSTPETLYVASQPAAHRLVQQLKPHLKRSRSEHLLEINPGFGYLTRELLKLNLPKIHLFETSSNYEKTLMNLQNEFPNRLEYKIEDFFNVWKTAFFDKLDSGNRIDKLFDRIKTKPWSDGYNMTVIGCTPSINFVKHLIMAIVFQNSLISIGRPELYLLMCPKDYLSLKTEPENNFHYKYTPVLFNLFFEHRLLAKMPREDYLPLQVIKTVNSRNKKKAEILNLEKDNLFLVHCCAKEKLPCSLEHLPLLWYFCKHHLRNRENRIIPKLEEWIPGCGIWLITEQDPPGTNLQTSPNENDARLPNITIFTQFHDLSDKQKLTLFKKFISWPEFDQSPFRDTLDNHIYKQLNNYELDTKIEGEADTEEESHDT